MTNKEKAAEERNYEKELNERKDYEIYLNTEEMENCENENIVVEICTILIEKDMSYREANRVLYNADKALRLRAFNKKLL